MSGVSRTSGTAVWPLAVLLLALGAGAGCPGGGGDTGDDDTTAAGDDDASGDDDATGDDDASGDDDATGDDDTTAAEPPPPRIEIPCVDALDDVYETPPGLPPWDPSVVGAVVRCAPEEVLSAAELHDRLLDAGVGDVTPITGAASYRVAYRTTRWAGEGGIGSARLWLPDVQPVDGALPLVVAGHGTVGIADHCAPSRYATVSDALTLSFAALGFSVIAPDYAGLGTEGVQGYGDNADTAHSMIDAARALRGIVTPGSIAPGSIAVGHSQGGGAALSTHAFDGSYGDGELLGAIPFAPGWSYETDALALAAHYPNLVQWSGTGALAITLSLYADAHNFLGPVDAYDYFDPYLAEEIAGLLDDECLVGLSLHLPPLAATLAGALDDDFLAGVAACFDGAPGCGPPADGYVQRAIANVVPVDAGGGPIVIVAGGQDTSATPDELACLAEHLAGDGVAPQICFDPDAEHLDVVERQAGFAVAWALALAAGEPLPACAETELPPCEAR